MKTIAMVSYGIYLAIWASAFGAQRVLKFTATLEMHRKEKRQAQDTLSTACGMHSLHDAPDTHMRMCRNARKVIASGDPLRKTLEDFLNTTHICGGAPCTTIVWGWLDIGWMRQSPVSAIGLLLAGALFLSSMGWVLKLATVAGKGLFSRKAQERKQKRAWQKRRRYKLRRIPPGPQMNLLTDQAEAQLNPQATGLLSEDSESSDEGEEGEGGEGGVEHRVRRTKSFPALPSGSLPEEVD